MRAQLLVSALRRRGEFRPSMCRMETTTLLQTVAAKPPRVALMMPNLGSLADSMASLRNFHLAHPEIIKVLVAESANREIVVGGFRSGIRGIFCLTDSNLRLLSKCIHRVAAGQVWADTEQMNYLLELIAEVPSLRVLNSGGHEILTPREQQVVALVAEGMGNREIARELTLSEHTIKKYLYRIFNKLGISTRVELVLYALNHGDPLRAQWLTGRRLIPPA